MNKIEQLKELKSLLDQGVINTSEFEKMKLEIMETSVSNDITSSNDSMMSGDVNISSVKIGSQFWMDKNLFVSNFRNGDPIKHAKSKEEWIDMCKKKKPAYCYYDNDEKNGGKYGFIYNWYAVNDTKGLAPKGWKIPSESDFIELIENCGGEEVAGLHLKSTTDWEEDENGLDKYGFNALPGGYIKHTGEFRYISECVNFWTSDEFDTDVVPDSAISLELWGSREETEIGGPSHKGWGFYVRCIQSETFGHNENMKSLIEEIVKAYDDLDIECLEDKENVKSNKHVAREFIKYVSTKNGRERITDYIDDLEDDTNEFTVAVLEFVDLISKIYKSGITELTNEDGKKIYPYALDNKSIHDFLIDKENSLTDKMSKIIDVTDNLVNRIEK